MAGTSNLPFSEELHACAGKGAVGPEERWFSAAAGACLVGYGLSKISLRTLVAMGVGGYLVYRGSTGRCPISEKLGPLTDKLGCDFLSSKGAMEEGEDVEGRSFAEENLSATECCDDVDPVDEAAMESFPASDPPSYSSGTSTPSQPIH